MLSLPSWLFGTLMCSAEEPRKMGKSFAGHFSESLEMAVENSQALCIPRFQARGQVSLRHLKNCILSSRLKVPQVCVLIPRACEEVALHGKGTGQI